MGSEQFSLCWNNFHTNLSTGFHSLFQGEHLVDVTLAAEGKILKAHKMVLSVCSPYFNELFRGNPCKHPIVFLKDVSASALDQLLTFMYRGEVSVRQDELTAFIKTAEALQIKGLTGQSNNQTPPVKDMDSHLNGSSAYLETLKNLPRDSHYMPSKKRIRQKHSLLTPSSSFKKSKMPSLEPTQPLLQPAVFSVNHPSTSRSNINNLDNMDDESVTPAKRSGASSLASSDREDHGGLPVETQFLEPVTPKQEPMDELDEYNDTSQYSDGTTLDDSMDASALLETKVSIGGDLNLEQSSSSSTATNWPNPKLKMLQMGEVPAPVFDTSHIEDIYKKTVFCIIGQKCKSFTITKKDKQSDSEAIRLNLVAACEKDEVLKIMMANKYIALQRKHPKKDNFLCDIEEDDCINDGEDIHVILIDLKLSSQNNNLREAVVVYEEPTQETESPLQQFDMSTEMHSERGEPNKLSNNSHEFTGEDAVDKRTDEELMPLRKRRKTDYYDDNKSSNCKIQGRNTVPYPAPLPKFNSNLQKLYEKGQTINQKKDFIHFWGVDLENITDGDPSRQDYRNYSRTIVDTHPEFVGGNHGYALVSHQISMSIRNRRCQLKRKLRKPNEKKFDS